MKEKANNSKDKFVRIKITRLKQKGLRGTAGSTQNTALTQMVNLEGNFVFSTLAGILKFRPYTYEVERSKANIYDAAYRVNLATKEGREAYNRAAFGDFRKMEEYAYSAKNVLKPKSKRPVLRLYTRKEKKDIRRKSKYVQLFLLSLEKTKFFRLQKLKRILKGKNTGIWTLKSLPKSRGNSFLLLIKQDPIVF